MSVERHTFVDVQFGCDGSDIPDESEIRRWVELAVAAAGRTGSSDIEVAVRVVSADEMQALNREYRNADKPTNVLSFPTGPLDGLPGDAVRPLGDLVVCAAVVSNEAASQHKPVKDHWAHMLVHGTLHLLAFDHTTDAEAREMEDLETRILAADGIADPYGVQ